MQVTTEHMQMLPPETAKCPWRSLAAGQGSQGLSCPDAVGHVLLLPMAHLKGLSSQTFLPLLYITGYSFPFQPFPFRARVSLSRFSAWPFLHRHAKVLVLTGQGGIQLVSGGSTRAGHVPWSRGECTRAPWLWCAAVPVTQGEDKAGRICWLMGYGHVLMVIYSSSITTQGLCLSILSR